MMTVFSVFARALDLSLLPPYDVSQPMQSFKTPMMQQYQAIKANYSHCLLFYRMGDFYELFLDDAIVGSKILNITLTRRAKGKDGDVPMAGVPYHSVDQYIAKLVAAGNNVAICEQLSPPSSTGIVQRGVIRVVTPGTILDEKALPNATHNYVVSLQITKHAIAFCYWDVSTGHIEVVYQETNTPLTYLHNFFAKLMPAECLLHPQLLEDSNLLQFLLHDIGTNISPIHDWQSTIKQKESIILQAFKVNTLDVFGIAQTPLAQEVVAIILAYVAKTQNNKLPRVRSLTLHQDESIVQLDHATITNLELFNTIRDRDEKKSVYTFINGTRTAMGARALRRLLASPLRNKDELEARYDAIDTLLHQPQLLKRISTILQALPDIERITTRITVGIATPRDIQLLGKSLEHIVTIKELLGPSSTPFLHAIGQGIPNTLLALHQRITSTLSELPPINVRDGGVIQDGIDESIDLWRKQLTKHKQQLIYIEQEEKKATGIPTLKVRYNSIFGYFIEVTKVHANRIPSTYQRKQTLVGGERFITPALKALEDSILQIERQLFSREEQVYSQLYEDVVSLAEHIQQACDKIAILDCIASFADHAKAYRYTRPQLTYSGDIHIFQGRHPVIERIVPPGTCIPNDTTIVHDKGHLLLITGPNMAGKSVYMRQIAILIIMAHLGSYIPAAKASIPLVDKVFVRSGASDAITSGLSTFMVEMVEAAYIIRSATKQSFVVLDEVGRGTSTYDGIALAWAIAEHFITADQHPNVVFATHYHELSDLALTYPTKVVPLHLAVEILNEEPIFLYEIRPGVMSKSFGIAVGKRAGLPESVIKAAIDKLSTLQSNDAISTPTTLSSLFKQLTTVDVNLITPLEAHHLLAQLQKISQV